MPSFSNRDIEEAKRRVREMQSRAERYVSGSRYDAKPESKNADAPPERGSSAETNQQHKEEKECEPENNSEKDSEEIFGDSFSVILLLILILSHEGADRKLLLALLYLLF